MTLRVVLAFALTAAIGIAQPAFASAQPADNTIDDHLRAAKRAAAFEFRGLLGALCVAPQNRPPPDVAPGAAARPHALLRRARQDVRRRLFRRHQGPLVLGAADQRRPHPDRHHLRIRGRSGDRRRIEEARLRSRGREIRHHHPRPSRRGRRRQDDAGPLRLAHRHGRRRLGHDREIGEPVSQGQAQARHRRHRAAGPHARRPHRDDRADARPHAGNAVADLSR